MSRSHFLYQKLFSNILCLLSLLSFGLLSIPISTLAEETPALDIPEYTVSTISQGLSFPWSIDFIDEQTAIVSEKGGSIKLLRLHKEQEKTSAELINIDLSQLKIGKSPFKEGLYIKGQGGLLDIEISPNFSENLQIYLTYSRLMAKPEGGATTLASAVLTGLPDKPQLEQFKELKISDVNNKKGRHFGSRIAFDSKGHIFYSIGDRGVRDNGQDASNLAAVIVRLNLDGSTPKDNPFIGKKINGKKAKPEIYSYGHRNPQGLYFDSSSQTLFENEHGPRGGDEINIIKAGHNYGWAEVSHGKEYWGPVKVGDTTEREDVTAPVVVYTPSIAPSGLIKVEGDLYPEIKGMLMSGALAIPQINLIALDENHQKLEEKRRLLNLNERIRDVTQSPSGLIYMVTDNGNVYLLDRKQ